MSDKVREDPIDVDQETQFQSSFEDILVGIAQLEVDGRCRHVNTALSKLTGYSPMELCEDKFQEITHPNDLNAHLKLFAKLQRGKIPHYRMEKRYFHKSGQIIWVDFQVKPQLDTAGNLVCYIATILDISAAKQLEEILRQTNKDKENLQQVMVHEMRGLLQSISSQAQVLSTIESESTFASLGSQAIANIQEYIENASEFISFIGSWSDLQTHSLELHRVAFKKVFDEVLDYLDISLSKTNTSVQLAEELPEAMGNHPTIRHIFINLIDNAVKYRRSDVPCKIIVKAARTTQGVTLMIQDNGRGIPEKDQRQVFLPGKRASNVGDVEGYGLGLSFCRQLMDMMGGSIELVSNPPKSGTEIILTFQGVDS